ncbi:MAG TPA: tRNA (adenosine(37)-N6)-dimethylallyltransferase MiaA [Dehalococcoidia bacterium]|nr:tRNA (adenosine(37)-N6)-dimethylallyltransferase MiaA [Dehalococcoidia bacterium]
MPRRRLLAVVGPTASGKTALAVELARRLDGEIVNADSRQVYRGMDIGTAKPTLAERAAARHWLIDVFDPDAPCSLADFLDGARAAMDDIWSRGRLPILCGGTGQYVWALLEAWRVPRVPPDHTLRAEFQQRAVRDGADALAEDLRNIDPASAAAIDPRNVRRVIRAIEVTRATGRPFSEWRRRGAAPFAATVLGLHVDRAELHHRIDRRVDAMIAAGLVGEVRALNRAGYGCDLPAMLAIGYREICDYLRGSCPLEEAIARIKTGTHRLARMQSTWFRANDPRITWLEATAADLLSRATAAARVEPSGSGD